MEINKASSFFYYNASSSARSRLKFRSGPQGGQGSSSALGGKNTVKKSREKLSPMKGGADSSPFGKRDLDVESETSQTAVDTSHHAPGSSIEGLDTFNAGRVFRLVPQQQRVPFCPDSVFVQQKPNVQMAPCKNPRSTGGSSISWSGTTPSSTAASSGASAMCDGCRCIVSILHTEAMSRQRVFEDEEHSRQLLFHFILSQSIVPKPLRAILTELAGSREKAQALGAWKQQHEVNSPLRLRRKVDVELSAMAPSQPPQDDHLGGGSVKESTLTFEGGNPTTAPTRTTSTTAGPWAEASGLMDEEAPLARTNSKGDGELRRGSSTKSLENDTPRSTTTSTEPAATATSLGDRTESPLEMESVSSPVTKPRAIDRLRGAVL